MGELEQLVGDQLGAWGLAATPEGGAALDIARRLGEEDLRPAAAAMLHAQLRSYLSDLRDLAPPADAVDDVADLQDEFGKLRAVR